MSYYLLPKKNIELNIKLNYSNEPLTPYVSHSLYYYLNHIENIFAHIQAKERERIFEKKRDKYKGVEKFLEKEKEDGDDSLYGFMQDANMIQGKEVRETARETARETIRETERETIRETIRETARETIRETIDETMSVTKGMQYDMQPFTVPPFIQPIFESCVFSPMTTPATSPPLYDSSFLVHFDETTRFNMERERRNSFGNSLGSYTHPPGLPIRPDPNTGPSAAVPFIPFQENNKSLTQMIQQLNTYEFIFSKVPNSNLSVSKLKPYSNTFYIYMEIFQMFRFLDFFENVNMKTLHVGKHTQSIMECLNIMREDSQDTHTCISSFHELDKQEGQGMRLGLRNSHQFLSYDLMNLHPETGCPNPNPLFECTRQMLVHLLKNQASNGICILQIQDLFHKPMLDLCYILTTMYEKVYIIKPNHSNIFKSERFILCKNFTLNSKRHMLYDQYIEALSCQEEDWVDLEWGPRLYNKPFMTSLLDNDLPYYFLCKIEESNIIIGHQQLENMDYLLSLYKGRNNEEKIEMIKKNNIQKCIQWCEKYKIPYNKFTEKMNIFIAAGKPLV
jgi:hypothetical protein